MTPAPMDAISTAASPLRHAPGPASPCVVELIDPAGALAHAAQAWLLEHACRALAHLNAEGEVRLRLVSDQDMARAHEQHLGQATTTDVITFDLSEPGDQGAPGEPAVLDVDLLLCVDEAARQADARAVPVERELLLYALHGVLHCLGEDDHDDARARAMHEREDRVLEAIGVGATFARAPAGSPRAEP